VTSCPLEETPTSNNRQRTAWNARDSDATLVLARCPLTGGTRFTVQTCRAPGKPHRVEDLADPATWTAEAIADVRRWLLVVHEGHTINIAGPRESKSPGVHARTVAFLREVLGGPTPEQGEP